MNDIEFVETDTEKIKSNVITVYESLIGRALAQGDPVRLFLESIASIIAQQRAVINFTGKMNLLAYAKDDYLDHLGLLVGTERLQATAAKTTLQVTLSEKRSISTVIPKGKRVTAGDNVFFATTADLIISAQTLTGTVAAQCTVTGNIGNGYGIGELKKLVDPIPFVAAITNTTITESGSDIEANESYRERIQTAPESFSCAGPDGAYAHHVKAVSALIGDVSVDSPTPGVVDIVVLLVGGEVPSTELLNEVKAAVNDKKVRPLTDNVFVYAPDVVNFDVDIKYYIDQDNQTQANAIQMAVESSVNDYVSWQSTKLGRDINPAMLISKMMNAGAKRVEVNSPAHMVLTKKQVAIANAPTISFGGLEDD